jgi:hypothetical protein
MHNIISMYETYFDLIALFHPHYIFYGTHPPVRVQCGWLSRQVSKRWRWEQLRQSTHGDGGGGSGGGYGTGVSPYYVLLIAGGRVYGKKN